MKIKLTYFERSGEYYTEAEYETKLTLMYEIFDEVKELQITKAPGLIGTAREFYIHVDPEGDKGYPGLILPTII